jgi:hypothetical protein
LATHEDAHLLVQLLRWATEMGIEDAYMEIFSEDFDPEKASVNTMAVGKIMTYGEAVGTFVKHGLLDADLVNDYWASRMVWDRVGQAAHRAREEFNSPRMYENFEALVEGSTA